MDVDQEALGYETYAYFYVCDFTGEPSSITDKLKINPTKTARKGDVIRPSQKLREFNSWEIHSPLNRSEIFLDVHIKAVLEIIEPKREQILELQLQGCTIGINCVGYYTDTHPGFGLSAELLSRLAVFSLNLDFDLYCLCS